MTARQQRRPLRPAPRNLFGPFETPRNLFPRKSPLFVVVEAVGVVGVVEIVIVKMVKMVKMVLRGVVWRVCVENPGKKRAQKSR